MSKKLSRFFRQAALVTTLGLSIAGCNNPATSPPEQQEQTLQQDAQDRYAGGQFKLTLGEARMLHDIFGDQINTGKLRLIFKKEARNDRNADYLRSKLTFYGGDYHSADYSSKEESSHKLRTFMHEATHAWQDQWLGGGRKCGGYGIERQFYPLESERNFGDYCEEQQASIIGDYAARFLHPLHTITYNLVSPQGHYIDDSPASDKLLKKVVEDAFPKAREARIRFESQRGKEGIPCRSIYWQCPAAYLPYP